MNTCLNIEPKLDNLVELSSICRGEWCRLLESEMDELDREMNYFEKSDDVKERSCLHHVPEKFRQGYKNVSPIYIF
jgi:hypothetical protein